MGARLSVFILRAHSSTSPIFRTRNGFFLTPGFFRITIRLCRKNTWEEFYTWEEYMGGILYMGRIHGRNSIHGKNTWEEFYTWEEYMGGIL
jgi:hypothetical protein